MFVFFLLINALKYRMAILKFLIVRIDTVGWPHLVVVTGHPFETRGMWRILLITLHG